MKLTKDEVREMLRDNKETVLEILSELANELQHGDLVSMDVNIPGYLVGQVTGKVVGIHPKESDPRYFGKYIINWFGDPTNRLPKTINYPQEGVKKL